MAETKTGGGSSRHHVVGRMVRPIAQNAVPKSRKMGTDSDCQIQGHGTPC